ncbi:DEAD/DEAH box helicase, partial [archaeon]
MSVTACWTAWVRGAPLSRAAPTRSHVRAFRVMPCLPPPRTHSVRAEFRKLVTQVFMKTPVSKQVMMFSATMSKEMKAVAHKYLQDPVEIYVENDSKLTLHGLQQYYVKLTEAQKNRRLVDLIDSLDFNQVVVFVATSERAEALNKLLLGCSLPSMCIHSRMDQK